MELSMRLLHTEAVVASGVCSRETDTPVHTKGYSRMFAAALFIAVKNGERPQAGARIINTGLSAHGILLSNQKEQDRHSSEASCPVEGARIMSPYIVGLHARDILEKATSWGVVW